MTDRELLELAAIACGELHGEWVGNDAYFDGVLSRWNPITDDGDALRLAATTGLVVDFQCRFGIGNVVGTGVWRHGHMEGPPEFWTAHGSDAGAASRYTIVRAAAEIGRQHD